MTELFQEGSNELRSFRKEDYSINSNKFPQMEWLETMQMFCVNFFPYNSVERQTGHLKLRISRAGSFWEL